MQTEFMKRLEEAKKQHTRMPMVPSYSVPDIPRELEGQRERRVRRACQAARRRREGAPSPPERGSK